MKFSISTLILLLAFTGLSASNPPVIVCLNGLSANIMVTGQITIWTSDLVAYATDDETPYIDLVMGMRIAGTGSGFPSSSSFTFTCDNVGENEMELWVMDADGNTAYCTTTVIIMDAFNVCPDQTPPILTSLNDVSVSMSQTGARRLAPCWRRALPPAHRVSGGYRQEPPCRRGSRSQAGWPPGRSE